MSKLSHNQAIDFAQRIKLMLWNNAKGTAAYDRMQIMAESLEAYLRDSQKQEDETQLWIWKDGEKFIAYKHEYPCVETGGDPLVLGEPSFTATLKQSFDRD